MQTEHQTLAFGDVHCRCEYPGYLLRHLRELGVELEITASDREILKYTVDFGGGGGWSGGGRSRSGGTGR
jgi:6-phospho-beta-glucosidase